MKKLLIVFTFLTTIVLSASAQDQLGKFSLAANLNYGTKIESLGVGLRAQYGFQENLRGSLQYNYFIDRHNLSSWGWNADGHYVFGVAQTVSLYPLAGLNFTRWTLDPGRSNILGEKYSDNRLGLNIGFGGQVTLSDRTFLQVEAKETFAKDYSQFNISVGFMYEF